MYSNPFAIPGLAPGSEKASPIRRPSAGRVASHRFLVPFEGSHASWRALEFAAEAIVAEGGRVHLLNVQRPVLDEAAFREPHRAAGNAILEPALARLQGLGIECTSEVLFGDEPSVIVGTALRGDCSAIVMSMRRRNAFVRMLAGSMTTRVMRLSTVPVIVVAGPPEPRRDRFGARPFRQMQA